MDHKILLEKVYHYGFRGEIFQLLNSYLAERRICTKINGRLSSPRIIDHGVAYLRAQFWDLFFSCFMLMTFCLHLNFKTTDFAEDTNLHSSLSNINTFYSRGVSRNLKGGAQFEAVRFPLKVK